MGAQTGGHDKATAQDKEKGQNMLDSQLNTELLDVNSNGSIHNASGIRRDFKGQQKLDT